MNGERLDALLTRLRGSLWFIPTLMTGGAVVLAVLTFWLDRRIATEMPQIWFLFSASAEGARAILSTIAGSIITVTGVVFSITIVALQLASSQYTPRVLRTFTDNRPTQVVLGIFIATFTYSLLVLRGVRSEVDEVSRFVPGVSITFALVLTLCSIGALIFFVNHIAGSIRVETVMDRIATDVLARMDVLFPEEIGDSATAAATDGDSPREESGRTAFPVRAVKGGYLQHVEDDALLELTEEHDLMVEMTIPVGSFLMEGDLLATATARGAIDADVIEHLRTTFRIGPERTLYQDISRGMIELTDIALRALSPSLNDPTTAIGAIDHITRLLHTLASRNFPAPLRVGADGRPRVLAVRPDFEEIVRPPLSQLRHSGAGQPAVAERLIRAIARICEKARSERIPPLLDEMDALMHSIRATTANPADLARLEDAAVSTLSTIRTRMT